MYMHCYILPNKLVCYHVLFERVVTSVSSFRLSRGCDRTIAAVHGSVLVMYPHYAYTLQHSLPGMLELSGEELYHGP